MKMPRIHTLSAALLALSMLPFSQAGCSKQAPPAATAAATPVPAPVPAAPVAALAPVVVPTPAPVVVAPAPAATPVPTPATIVLDFGDNRSETLTVKAWQAIIANNNEVAIAYAKRCIDTYRPQAVAMQQALTAPVPNSDKDVVSSKWALNDVGTCYYILGQVYEREGNNKDATTAYQSLVTDLPFAQCWDPKGWFWSPATAAKDRIKALQLDALK